MRTRALPCRQCENSAERGDEDQEVVERPMVGSTILYRGVAQFGSALGSGPRGRGFKSRHLDHKKDIAFLQCLFCFFSRIEPTTSQKSGSPKIAGNEASEIFGGEEPPSANASIALPAMRELCRERRRGFKSRHLDHKKDIAFLQCLFCFFFRIEPTTSQNGTIFPQKAVCI